MGDQKNVSDSLNKILSVHLSGHSQQQMLRCVCWLMWETASRRGKKMLPWGSVWVSSSVPERCVCSGPRGLSLIWGHATSAPLCCLCGPDVQQGRSCVHREYANWVWLNQTRQPCSHWEKPNFHGFIWQVAPIPQMSVVLLVLSFVWDRISTVGV